MEPKSCEKGPKVGCEYWPTFQTSHYVRTACMAFPLKSVWPVHANSCSSIMQLLHSIFTAHFEQRLLLPQFVYTGLPLHYAHHSVRITLRASHMASSGGLHAPCVHRMCTVPKPYNVLEQGMGKWSILGAPKNGVPSRLLGGLFLLSTGLAGTLGSAHLLANAQNKLNNQSDGQEGAAPLHHTVPMRRQWCQTGVSGKPGFVDGC